MGRSGPFYTLKGWDRNSKSLRRRPRNGCRIVGAGINLPLWDTVGNGPRSRTGEGVVRPILLKNIMLPLLIAALAATAPARAEESQKKDSKQSGTISDAFKKAGHEFVQDAKAAGRDIRNSTVGRKVEGTAKEIGHDTAETSKKGWDKTKSFSASAADEVKRATREFWDDVIHAKEAVAEKLRKENADLKSKKEDPPSRSETAKEVP